VSPKLRFVAAVTIGVLLLVGLTVGAAGFVFHRYGEFRVKVTPKAPDGDAVSLRVPGALVHALLPLIPNLEIEDAELTSEQMAAVFDAWREFVRAGDGVLVRASNQGETVLVVKRRGHLEIHVESVSETVDVSVPIRTVDAILGKLLPRKPRQRHRAEAPAPNRVMGFLSPVAG
jgi:hypothetical protein